MKKLFVSVVVFISLLSGSASSVGASTVNNSNKHDAVVRVNHIKRQRKNAIYHVRRNRISNHSNRSRVVAIRFNGRKAAEYKMKKHETVAVFGRDSKIPTLLNRTKAFFTKHHTKVTYSFQNHIGWGLK